MPVDLTLDGKSFHGHGICGLVQAWPVGNGVTVTSCHGNDFIVIDDYTATSGNGARKKPPASSPNQTPSGLHYETPIDTRSLRFDNEGGTMRSYGMEGACVDLAVSLNAGQRLVFSWKFISFDRGSRFGNNFAMVLAYAGQNPPLPAAAPKIEDITASGPPANDLFQGAVRLLSDAPTERFAEGRDPSTNTRVHGHWSTSAWTAPNGFNGTIRWIVCSGWSVLQEAGSAEADKSLPGTENESLRKQRAFPATLLLDCVEII